ncbi:metallophosphoesterase [Agrilactobacillus yilanensis]|uniref:Metallophosphoesterase n=1 Tax=Agrilactobacillus yilanensis TaxID=2485997 RepID=A0ABW4J5S4_9LACO|nr:metallophosphoesterase [Agrilactobacillus yilanensis]
MDYFIADTHFFHQTLLEPNDFAPRHFESVAAMDAQLVTAWNDRVTAHDTVYHLGDIALRPGNFPKPPEVYTQIEKLNGHIIFIKGNHDARELFKYISARNYDLLGQPKYQFHDVGALIKFNHAQYYLTHYPMFLGIATQIYNLHGHIHHTMMPSALNINVGVDAPERDLLTVPLPFGTPLKAIEIEEMIQKKQALIQNNKKIK